jgi:hypothetical protein
LKSAKLCEKYQPIGLGIDSNSISAGRGPLRAFSGYELVSSVDRKPDQRFLAEPVGGQLTKSGGVDTETTGWAFGSNDRNAISKRSLASIDSRQYQWPYLAGNTQ